MSKIPKKRKPRRENDAEVDGVPSKVPKITENPRRSETGKRKFSVKDFRKKLQGDNFISDFRHFVEEAKENPGIIEKYLEAGGQPLEIVTCLGKIDKAALDQITHILSALQLTLIEILSRGDQYSTVAIAGCRFLLNKHRNCIESLLESHATNHRKIALKVLTACVTLDSRMGFDVLKLFRVHLHGTGLMERFAKHRKEEIGDPGSSLRTAFIHFVLAYLVAGNSVLIQNILDKMELIVAVLTDLHYDTPETIVLVLGTLRNYVLKKVSVSKTQKFHLFSAEIVGNLMQLYTWKGPKAFLAMTAGDHVDSIVPEAEEVEVVSAAIHEFLKLLLTSNKFGIAVQVLGHHKKKKNLVHGAVLKNIQTPWDNPLYESLVIHTLKACPEQVEFFLRARSRFFNVRQGDKQILGKSLNFLEKLIDFLSPKIIQRFAKEIGMTQMCTLIKNITLYPEVLEGIRDKTLRNVSFEIRVLVTKLLTTMLSQCSNYLISLEEWEVYQEFEMKIIKTDLFEHVLRNFPTLDAITHSLYKTIDEQKDLGSEDVLKHLEATVDLLSIAAETIPSFIDKTTSLINYMQLMGPLHAQQGAEERKAEHAKIELKIIKLILALDPQVVSPGTPLFTSIMTSFLNLHTFGGVDGIEEVQILLRNILFSTRLFDSGPLEIDIWLEAFKTIDPKDINIVQEFFIKLISRVKTKPEDFEGIILNRASGSTETGDLGKILQKIEKDEATVGIIDVPGLNSLLPIAVHLAGKKKASRHVVKYLESVVFDLFHYLPNPEILPGVVEKLAVGVSDYMLAFGRQSHVLPCEFTFPEANKLVKIIVETREFDESFLEDVQSDGKAFNLIYLIIFHHIHLQKISKLDKETSSLCSKYIWKLLDGIYQRHIGQTQKKRTIVLDEVVKVKISRDNPLNEILKYIFCTHIHLLTNFEEELEKNSRPTIDFLTEILLKVKEWNLGGIFEELTVNYRRKLVQHFQKHLPDDEEFVNLLQTLSLDQENSQELLESIIQRPQKDIHRVLVLALERITSHPLPGNVVRGICEIAMNALAEGIPEASINALSDSLTEYLMQFHSSIGDVPEDFFHKICTGERHTKSLTRLAGLLLERNSGLFETFQRDLEDNFAKKELMYPLLNVVLDKKEITLDRKLLQRIFGEYKNGIMKSIEKPLKTGMIYRENVRSSIRLVEECMSGKDCTEFTKKTLKPDSVETFQCLLIEAIYRKALEIAPSDGINVNFYKNFLNLFTILLKKGSPQVEKLQEIAKIITNWPGTCQDFSSLTESSIWTNFSRSSLKIGLQAEIGEESGSLLLNLLGNLVDRIYPDDGGDDFVKELYEMTFSHSNFMEVFLQRKKSQLKTATAFLLLMLAKKNPSGFDKQHIPVLLGAYGALLSKCDRFILALLCLYEKNGVDFTDYTPLLWGESAIAHFSLEATEEAQIKGILEEPSMDMVMSIISLDTMKYTLSNYPVWRGLNPTADLPGTTNHPTKTEIEMTIEGISPKDPKFSCLLTKKQETWDDVYDPAFFIPLLSAMFAPEVFTSAIAVAQNGLLGLAFEALSSNDEEMRRAAGLALVRYKRHMEGRKEFLDRNVWFHFYGGVQNGLGALGKVMDTVCPRLPHVSANFLAKASIVLTTPLAQLYKPIADYILSKETYNLAVVPNFNFMFLSADVDHHGHREFLLGVIADGVKCEEDFDVLDLSGALETLMVFFSCPFATIDTNLRILGVINTIARIPKCAAMLMDKYAIVAWLCGIIGNLETFYYDTIDAIVHIIVNLCYSMDFLGDRTDDCTGDRVKICHMALKMVKFLSARMPMAVLGKFIGVLNRTSHGQYHLMPEGDLDHMIECAKPMIAEEIAAIERIRENGAAYAESGGQYAGRLVGIDAEHRVGLINLREYVINWTSNRAIAY
ncbi:nucleolar pre-ribosomal-associated protein 1 [Lutzomyia longipalpis]|uniref:nucleolar pre-ribosomal-associated protein 1 n=1 Tax=Lutzomyia longipalpis TaxID=7200 RepID=UPI002483DE46|nr:nucleolar pre-ribosomal-associated protein 1 [Lutzomyia longipalpis]XP_055693294.1 nucleolar pre-ribosomal-associated protein 1 [Lutzomyia longipalpis]